MEAPTGIEPVMEVLQTSALPLGYGATRPRSYHRPVNVSTEPLGFFFLNGRLGNKLLRPGCGQSSSHAIGTFSSGDRTRF